jgi:8-oxo-dGTP pyrophosphatase MutT (NUDIX family)
MSSLGKDTNDVVGVICLDKKGKLLLVQGAGGKWSFPKGRRKENETPLQGALREAKEEAGIDLSRESTFLNMNLRFGSYFWYYLDTDGESIPLTDPLTPAEILQAAWVSPHSDTFLKQEKNADLRAYLMETKKSKRKY